MLELTERFRSPFVAFRSEQSEMTRTPFEVDRRQVAKVHFIGRKTKIFSASLLEVIR